MLPAKLPSKQLQVIWYSVINSIIHQWWSGKCYCLLPKYLYLTRTWLKKYLMYLMSSKYSEYLNLYLYLQIWKSTCTWLKYFEKYLTPTRAGVKYVLSNTNTNTNTFFSGVSNTNTNTNTQAKIWSNTNTNTNTAHQIQIQIHNEAETKLPPFYRWHIEIYCIVRRLFIYSNFTENCFQRSNLQ